jgi:uncharacterized membrane protein (UPF0127 family)
MARAAPPPPGEGVLFVPGGSVHTAFVRFRIDVVFLDADGRVLRAAAAVPPWRFRRAPRGTRFVLELAGSGDRPALDAGDSLGVVDGEWSALRRRFGRAPRR